MNECKQCGNCCKHILITAILRPQDARPEVQEHLLLRGIGEEGEPFNILLPHKCQHLNEDNLCNIYEDRPQLCKAFYCVDDTACPECESIGFSKIFRGTYEETSYYICFSCRHAWFV